MSKLSSSAPEFKPPFPEKPPQVSKGLDVGWNWDEMAKKGKTPVSNVPNPYSTTAVKTGKGKRRKTRNTKNKRKVRKTRKIRK